MKRRIVNEIKPHKKLALVAIILFMGSILAGAGVVKVEYTKYLTFADAFGSSPIDDVKLRANFTRVAYSDKPIYFLERFDDSNENNWTYYETGADTTTSAPLWAASNLILLSKGDGTNYTKIQYSHRATTKNKLKPSSSGGYIYARIGEVVGTPVGGIELTNSSYYIRVGFDGSGNIDLNYHASGTGTLTNTQIVSSAQSDKWYTVAIEFYSTTASIQIYNETGVQKGDTQTVSTALSFSAWYNLTLWCNSTSSTSEVLAFDWLYTANRYSSTPNSEISDTLPNTKDSAPEDKEVDKCDFGYEKAGIENDSASSEAREVFNYTAEADDFEGKTSYNNTEFRDFISSVSEVDNDVADTQTYYAKGWDNLQKDLETSLEGRLSKIAGKTVYAVDYVILDLNLSITYSDDFLKMAEDWFKKDAVKIIQETDPDATVTLENGEVVSVSKVPAEMLGAFLFGQYSPAFSLFGGLHSIKEVVFSSPEKAKSATQQVSKEFRDTVMGGAGIVQGSVSSVVDSSKNIIGQTSGKVNDLVDTYVVSPTNAIAAGISSGTNAVASGVNNAMSGIGAKLSDVSASLRDSLAGISTSIKDSIRGLTSTLSSSFQSAIGSIYHGIRSPISKMGKSLDKAFSFFSYVGGVAKTFAKYLMIGGAIVVGVVAIYYAWSKGLLDKVVSRG